MANEARIIDGRAIAAKIRGDVAKKVAFLKDRHDITPGLAVVMVGEDPASQTYVRNKAKAAMEVGIENHAHLLPDDTTQKELVSLIH